MKIDKSSKIYSETIGALLKMLTSEFLEKILKLTLDIDIEIQEAISTEKELMILDPVPVSYRRISSSRF